MDQKILFLINREWTSPLADWCMAVLSSWDFWLPIFALVAIVLLVRGGFKARAFVVAALLVIAFNDGLLARFLKRAIDRPRPHQALSDVRIVELAKARPRLLAVAKPARIKMSRSSLEDVSGRSFPSSHTVNMFSLATVTVAFFGWRGWWSLLLAAGVGYSRIYTGAHWPSDVFVSIFLGVGSSLFLLLALEAAWRRWGAPRTSEKYPTLLAT